MIVSLNIIFAEAAMASCTDMRRRRLVADLTLSIVARLAHLVQISQHIPLGGTAELHARVAKRWGITIQKCEFLFF